MKWLAIYTTLIGIFFSLSSVYYAVVGDNTPLWIFILFLNLPIIAFASLYLSKNTCKRKGG